jgi:three-Cys-motif partner protein
MDKELGHADGPGKKLKLDEIGYWSEIKLDIVKRYATEYSRIVSSQGRFQHWYVDAFSGSGYHRRKQTKEFVLGSPFNALAVEPPFNHYVFIDLDGDKVDFLRQQVVGINNVEVEQGDCNKVLLDKVFPNLRYDNYRRALCLLDPYGLTLEWEVIKTAGEMRSIELFLNFPMMHINRNVLRLNTDTVNPKEEERFTALWGDVSWKKALYDNMNLFGFDEKLEKGNRRVVEGFQSRLLDIAGFRYVPDPLPMRNVQGAIVYYLFFASPNKTGEKIVKYIFDKYRERGAM